MKSKCQPLASIKSMTIFICTATLLKNIEVVSKSQIVFEGPAKAGLHVQFEKINVCIKAQAESKAQHTR